MGYIPHTEQETRDMLAAVGVASMEELFADIPAEVRFRGQMEVPPALTESEIIGQFSETAQKNRHLETRPCFMGAGAYRHFVPSVVDAILSRAEFSTAYTPYQPEASQGTLQIIFEFQSLICALTAMDVANASLYDGASACAEAATLCATATGRSRVLVSRALHPEYRQVLQTYNHASGLRIEEVPLADGGTDTAALYDMLGADVAGVIVQDPNFFGVIEANAEMAQRVHQAGALLVAVNNDLTAMALLKRPGEWGADIAVGEAAATGLPLSLGGPYAGFIAVKEQFTKRMPGRLAGLTTDQDGRRGFCLTLQTREQHIRREKATSNICTNQSLCALGVTVYLTALGPKGLREVAEACARRTRYAVERFSHSGVFKRRFSRPYYHECVLASTVDAAEVNAAWARGGILGGYVLGQHYPELADCLLICATEMLSRQDIDAAAKILTEVRHRGQPALKT